MRVPHVDQAIQLSHKSRGPSSVPDCLPGSWLWLSVSMCQASSSCGSSMLSLTPFLLPQFLPFSPPPPEQNSQYDNLGSHQSDPRRWQVQAAHPLLLGALAVAFLYSWKFFLHRASTWLHNVSSYLKDTSWQFWNIAYVLHFGPKNDYISPMLTWINL